MARTSKAANDARERTQAALKEIQQGVNGAARRRPRPQAAPATPSYPRLAPAAPGGLTPGQVRDALREAPARPESGNARITPDVPVELREQWVAYRAWWGFTERELVTTLIRQLLAADPDGGWRTR